MILQAYRRLVGSDVDTSARLAIVPRKPERFDEVARLIERGGFSCLRRTRHPDGADASMATGRGVILGDTMGELRKFYWLADAVFVGRSLVPMGGSDPMEVAALQKPIVIGPHVENFRLPVEALARADAIATVDSVESLATRIGSILGDSELAEGLGRRARQVVVEHQGATARTIDGLMRVIEQHFGAESVGASVPPPA